MSSVSELNEKIESQTIEMLRDISERFPILSEWESCTLGSFKILGIYPIIASSNQGAIHVTSNSIAQFTFYYNSYREDIEKILKTCKKSEEK
jgi:hypothetical protein